MNAKFNSPRVQQGIVLVMGLVMLLLLMIIGTSGMKTTIMEEKMAGNTRMNNLVFQAAESALLAAEAKLKPANPSDMPTFTQAGTGGYYSSDTSVNVADGELKKASFWTSNPVGTSTVNNLGSSIATPQFIIQYLGMKCFKATCGSSDSMKAYQITVRAASTSANNVVILQSIYAP